MTNLYLKNALNYLTLNAGENLLGVIIYGSYTTKSFDTNVSDFDLIIVVKKDVSALITSFEEMFPRISVQLCLTPIEIIKKIQEGGWNTYLVLTKTGTILYDSEQFSLLREEIKKNSINFRNLSLQDKTSLVKKFKGNVQELRNKTGYNFTKYFYYSFLRVSQILHFIRTGKVETDFNALLSKIDEEFIKRNLIFLFAVQRAALKRARISEKEIEKSKGILEDAIKVLEIELNLFH